MCTAQSGHTAPVQQHQTRCLLYGPSPVATGLGCVTGPSENRRQLTSSAPPAERQALHVLNFLPAMKSGTTCTDKENRKLAKQRHLPCSLNVPEETFSKPFITRRFYRGVGREKDPEGCVYCLLCARQCKGAFHVIPHNHQVYARAPLGLGGFWEPGRGWACCPSRDVNRFQAQAHLRGPGVSAPGAAGQGLWLEGPVLGGGRRPAEAPGAR